MCLKDDGISDPEGIKVRAVPGIKGCDYLEAHSIMNSLSYVMGPLVVALKVRIYDLNDLQPHCSTNKKRSTSLSCSRKPDM